MIAAIRARAVLTVLAILAGAPRAPGAEPPAQERPRNVVLISWDGADRTVVRPMLKAGTLPNLAALAEAGSIQDIEIAGHLTETRPGHAEMLTGVGPKLNKIRSNASPGPIPAGLTLFDRLKKHFGPGEVATIAVTGKTYVGTLFGASEKNIDVLDAAYRLAGRTGPAALEALEKHRKSRFFAFLHFADPDSAGHRNGRDSEPYRAAIAECDEWLGKVVARLERAKIRESTRIYVTADHGFDAEGTQHYDAPDVWLVTDDRSVSRGGSQADVPATILAALGVDLEKLEPRLEGRPLAGAPREEPVPAGR